MVEQGIDLSIAKYHEESFDHYLKNIFSFMLGPRAVSSLVLGPPIGVRHQFHLAEQTLSQISYWFPQALCNRCPSVSRRQDAIVGQRVSECLVFICLLW